MTSTTDNDNALDPPVDERPYSYDAVPYVSHVFPQTHPDRLATVARLFGLAPQAIDASRVLEIGCASGGNLIPMACQLPDSNFVGVDLSKTQIDDGLESVRELKLANIELRHANLLDIDATWGKFDYIVAHGVYSWVPAEVQDKILSIYRDNLSPDGVGFVSYNVFPGWHMRGMIRHMMNYHIAPLEGPETHIKQSRALLKFLSDTVPAQNNPYGMILRRELEILDGMSDAYLFHEHLEENNEPVFFHEFAERARNHSLSYVGDVTLGNMLALGFGEKVERTLAQLSQDVIRKEQYMDFLRNRAFRESLLCKQGAAIDRRLDPNRIQQFRVRLTRPLTEMPRLARGAILKVRDARGRELHITRPITQAAMMILHEALPRSLEFGELVQRAMDRLSAASQTKDTASEATLALASDMLHQYIANVAELSLWEPDFADASQEHPRMFPVAARQIERGQIQVVNQRHQYVALPPMARALAPVLDGTRGRAQLVEFATKQLGAGRIRFRSGADGAPWSPPPAQAPRLVEQALKDLYRSGLLVN